MEGLFVSFLVTFCDDARARAEATFPATRSSDEVWCRTRRSVSQMCYGVESMRGHRELRNGHTPSPMPPPRQSWPVGPVSAAGCSIGGDEPTPAGVSLPSGGCCHMQSRGVIRRPPSCLRAFDSRRQKWKCEGSTQPGGGYAPPRARRRAPHL